MFDFSRLGLSVVFASLFLLLVGCSSPRGDIPVNPASFGVADPTPVVQTDTDYRINALDKFKMTVFRVPDLTGDYQVELSGIVNLPLIGSIAAAGMTSDQLTTRIENAYAARYIRDPRVTIQLTEIKQQQVLVGGSVKQPGLYEVIGASSLLQLVSRASGPDEYANSSRVVVFRTIDGQRNVAAFNYKRIAAGLDPNPTIYPGDEVLMDGSALKRTLHDALSIVPLLGIFQIATGF
ncbi:polysaccharide export protein [Sphingorhabdus soli]|uniref:Polysaccharide export protein n=1 Tax=Flavisphingopyxis soli TaxID=2601267 RepID=A0A5C6UNV4_9SPHN|nr:polysaccharide biosynthesis/export family protein [Sphingorhabdus soli]TXC74254.1 polysaccharide export protein [Sphingorhabdus soli]